MQETRRAIHKPIALTGIFAVLLLLALIAPVPRAGRELNCLGDLLHVAFFAVLGAFAFTVLQVLRPHPRIWWIIGCWAVVAVFGITTEWIQPSFGRNASWGDVWADACGALAGIMWLAGRTASTRGFRIRAFALTGMALLTGTAQPFVVLTDAALQRIEMPVVASFEHPLEQTRWTWRECRVERVREHATDGDRSMRVDLLPGVYPGVVMPHPLPDWSGFHGLTMDIYLDGKTPLDVIVRINDKTHNFETDDRYRHFVSLAPGRNTISIELADVADAPRSREMNLRRIAAMSVFTVSLESPRTFFLDNIRLQ